MKKLLAALIIIYTALNCNGQNIEHLTEKNTKIDSFKVVEPTYKYSKVSKLINVLLSRYHYKKPTLNDSLSSVIYENYLRMFDYSKLYFLQKDIDEFEKYRYKFDDFLNTGDLDPAFDIFNLFKSRLYERIKYAVDKLKTEFDYSIDENFEPDRKDAQYAKSENELNELWRKRLKNDALNLKLNGKDWDGISKTLTDRYKRFHKTILQYDAEDVFQVYMNAFAEAIDPHTSYFSPITSDNFNIQMKLSLEGIGAQLTLRDDYTTVVRIIPGGPADRDKRLKEDDRIVAVGQGDSGEMVDIIGWPTDDVVQLIRGKKGTIVRLSILNGDASPDMPPEEIVLKRDEVKLEEQAAKKDVFSIEENGKEFRVGVIDIPSFYVDFQARSKGEKDYRSTTRDVHKLIDSLKTEGVDGIIIDLRNNGGGSLQEAIEMTGLFINYGPVVQVKNSLGKVEVDRDPDPAIYYDGPLAVLINRYSASASEIFSAAIQDYGRGMILGEQSYGKGTVQNMHPLSRFIPAADEKLGELKLTIAKFYRITGGSTQHLGVVPDIKFPSAYQADDVGESSHPSALRWDEIDPVDYNRYSDLSKYIPELTRLHEKRILNNNEFKYTIADIEQIKERKKKTSYSLLESSRKAERDKNEEIRKMRENEREQRKSLLLKGNKEIPEYELIIDDPFLEESGHILADYIRMSIG